MSFENNFIKISFDKKTNILYINFKTAFPLVEKELDEFIDALNVFYLGVEKTKIKFTLWFDTINLGVLPFSYYNKLIEFFKENEKISEDYLFCTIVLSINTLINSIINKFLMIYKNKRPIKITDTKEIALEFLKELE